MKKVYTVEIDSEFITYCEDYEFAVLAQSQEEAKKLVRESLENEPIHSCSIEDKMNHLTIKEIDMNESSIFLIGNTGA